MSFLFDKLKSGGKIMLKKTVFLVVVTALFVMINTGAIRNMEKPDKIDFTDLGDEYSWAKEAIDFLSSRGIISGVGENLFLPASLVTREQTAAMLKKAFDLKDSSGVQTYTDVPPDRWSFDAVEATKDILIKSNGDDINKFDPESPMERAETAASCVKAMGLGEEDLLDSGILEKSFHDHSDINASCFSFVALAAERGILKGGDGFLRPNDYVTRAEAAVIIYRAMLAKEGKGEAVTLTQTPILDSAHITAERAAEWAAEREAAQIFIDVAPLYWKYGEMTGINPEIMYAQAAKETNFGKYTGNVKPEQNNWAGIKIYSPTGDKAEDHESFETPDDGVRAHFNHMSAYVGTEPIGQTHARYEIVKNLAWAGTVKYAEELGTKWAPDYTYGYSLVAKYVTDMRS